MERVDAIMERGRKGLILKTLKRCGSLGNLRSRSPAPPSKTMSWPGPGEKQNGDVPDGHFTVYVGAGKERFVIKTELINHQLFRQLLDEAESEYGFTQGPLQLPCEVDLFRRVLAEIEDEKDDSPRTRFAKRYARYQKLSMSKLMVTTNQS